MGVQYPKVGGSPGYRAKWLPLGDGGSPGPPTLIVAKCRFQAVSCVSGPGQGEHHLSLGRQRVCVLSPLSDEAGSHRGQLGS